VDSSKPKRYLNFENIFHKNFKYYLSTSSDLVAGLEGQMQAYGSSIHKKSELYGDLCEEFRKIRSEIEKNIYITYPVTFAQVLLIPHTTN